MSVASFIGTAGTLDLSGYGGYCLASRPFPGVTLYDMVTNQPWMRGIFGIISPAAL